MPITCPAASRHPLKRKAQVRPSVFYLLFLVTLLRVTAVTAETRRAVIIGINSYAVNPQADRTNDLDGAVNDAEAMAETLRTYHSFQSADIHVVLDKQATRARVMKEIQEHLIDRAQPGDISLFFFAGHGSYRDNLLSRELDHRDETIVPADTNRGVEDISDKELASLFNHVLDRHASLVGIFDSCHSGSIARGFAGERKTRFATPRANPPATDRTTPGPASVALPEERGALILAAAQDQQAAQERYVKGQPRGRFSSALQQLLNSGESGESVDSLFLRLRALMQAGGSVQEPAIAATKDRRLLTLWGSSAGTRGIREPPLVAVGRVTAEVVYLQAGFAIGLGGDATLVSTGSSAPTQLKIAEVLGPTRSRATVEKGKLGGVKPGDLFAIQAYGAPYLEPLRVFIPPQPPNRAQVDAMATRLSPLRSMNNMVWVKDPTESTPTHTLLWQDGQWVLREPQRPDVLLGVLPTLRKLLRELHSSGSSQVRLFFSAPLPAEQLPALASGPAGNIKRVEVTTVAAHADYILVGRLATRQLEYAWLLPGVEKAGRSGMPVRSEWGILDEASFVANLADDALRLARLKTWQSLDTPAGVHRFPYRLQLQDLNTHKYLALGTTIHRAEAYRPVLLATGAIQNVQPRYVYLFTLDANGGSTLLVPGREMSTGEILLPDSRDRGPAPLLIPLGHGFRCDQPFGTDTLILLTSATALPDPSVLVLMPLNRGLHANGACAHPLECLAVHINQNQTRSKLSAPVDWSIERLLLQCEP